MCQFVGVHAWGYRDSARTTGRIRTPHIYTYILSMYICIFIHVERWPGLQTYLGYAKKGVDLMCASVLLCFNDQTMKKIRNEASSCPGIFSSTFRFYYVASSPGSPLPHLVDGHRKLSRWALLRDLSGGELSSTINLFYALGVPC